MSNKSEKFYYALPWLRVAAMPCWVRWPAEGAAKCRWSLLVE